MSELADRFWQEENVVENRFVICEQCDGEPGILADGSQFHDHFCIRCDDKAPAADKLGYCGLCHWAAKAEVVDGSFDLKDFLENHAKFLDWCAENNRF